MPGGPPEGKHILAAKDSQKRRAFDNPIRAISLEVNIASKQIVPERHPSEIVWEVAPLR